MNPILIRRSSVAAAAITFVLVSCFGVVCAFAAILPTGGTGDGMAGRDWYSTPNYYWVDNTNITIQVSHDGDMRWWYRGLTIFDVSSLAGVTLPATNGAILKFYSFGFSGVTLQYAGMTGSAVTPAHAGAGGPAIADLGPGEGWESYDVTSHVQSGIVAGYHYIGFAFGATVNFGSGSLAASEDPGGRGAYIQIAVSPSVIRLESPRITAGHLLFEATGLTVGKTNVLLTSTNLTAWLPVNTNTAAGTAITITNAADLGQRFYRVVELP